MAFTPLEQPEVKGGFTPLKAESKGGFTPIKAPEDKGATQAFAKSALSSAATSVAAAPAMTLGAEIGGEIGMVGGPIGAAAGAVIGGFVGYMGGSKIIEAAADTLPQDLMKSIGYDKATRMAEITAHPDASFAGDLTGGGLALFTPGKLKAVEYAKDKFISPLAQRVGMAGFGGAVEAGQQATSDKKMNPAHVAEAALAGAVLAKPNAYSEKLGGIFHSRTPVMSRDMSEWIGRNREWTPAPTTADGVPIVIGKTGTDSPIVRTPDNITVDLDHIKSSFKEQPWASPKLEGVKPLAKNEFKSEAEWAQFELAREETRSRMSKPPFISEAEHQNLINELSLEHIRGNPEYNLPDVHAVEVPKEKDAMGNWLGNGLYSLGKGTEADKAIGMQFEKFATEELGYNPQDAVAIRKSFETGNTSHLDPRQMEIRSKFYDAANAEVKRLTAYGIKEGIMDPVHMNEAETGYHFSSKLIPKTQSFGERFKKAVSGGQGGFDQNIAGKRGAGTERNVFIAESPNGHRMVVQRMEDGSLIRWDNGRHYKFAEKVPQLRAGETLGQYKIKNHTVEEVEKHTPFTYEKDSMGVLYERLAELRSTIRAHEYIKEIRNSDWFAENAHKIEPGKEMPEGYARPKHLDKLPQFEGYAFPKRTAEIIEDFAKNYNENLLTFFSGALIKNMMLNPIPHIFNEGWHLYNARGLTGWVTPAGITRFAKTGVPALKSVLKMDDDYMETLRLGGSILSANVRSSAFQEQMFNKANKEFTQTPEGMELAKKLGTDALGLYDRLSKKSNQAMWTVRDMMYMQQVNENMRYKGMTREQAIKETERHMPNYRITPRVGEKVLGEALSRSLSETLQNPNVTVFSRYHYGLVKSLIETGKDISAIRKGKEGFHDFAHGVDTLAAIAVALAALYPLQDMIAQKLTGNDDAVARRAGPYHIFHAIDGIMNNEKDPMAALSSIFTFNPALLSGAQLIFDRKLYNGQPVYNPEDDADKIAYDVGKYLLTQIPQISQAEQAVKAEDEGFRQWAARQLDIESPTTEQVVEREKQKYKREKAGARRSAKWRAE